MVTISFAMGEALFAVAWLVARILCARRTGSVDWRREALLLLMYVNLAIIIRFTFFPLNLVDGKVQPLVIDFHHIWLHRVNLRPIKQLFWYETFADLLSNVVGNVLLFVPSGIILPIAFPRLDNFLKVVLSGAAISLCIEVAQLPCLDRGTDVDDVMLNALGVAIGYVIFSLVRRATRRRTSRP